MKPILPALAAALVVACTPAPRTRAEPLAESRVYDARAERIVPFTQLADAAANADVVFFGEQHDDPATHRAELALLAAVGARRAHVVLSLEMFERDAQPTLDAYLAGQLPESTFLATSRPWPRYTTDYRAMVELARAHRWPVVAANVPRRIATAVSRGGITVLDTLARGERNYAALELSCARTGEYYDRFADQMRGHSAGGGPGGTTDSAAALAMTGRFYEAQCVKDETMAESIVRAWTASPDDAVVIHYNGAFHSDRGLGTAERVMRRVPTARVLVVTAIPVDDVATASAMEWRDRGDFVLLVPKPPGSR